MTTIYYDYDYQMIVTRAGLRINYDLIKEEDEAFDESFEEYVENCQNYNGGSLQKLHGIDEDDLLKAYVRIKQDEATESSEPSWLWAYYLDYTFKVERLADFSQESFDIIKSEMSCRSGNELTDEEVKDAWKAWVYNAANDGTLVSAVIRLPNCGDTDIIDFVISKANEAIDRL